MDTNIQPSKYKGVGISFLESQFKMFPLLISKFSPNEFILSDYTVIQFGKEYSHPKITDSKGC